MARIRTVKPSHWSDKELPKISLQAHLLWIGIWNFSDDDGVFENDPLLLKSQIFPRRTDIRVEQVKTWLDQLVKVRFIIPFTYNGESYFVNRTFKAHQRIDKPQDGKIPEDELVRIFADHSKNVLRIVPPVLEGIVRDGSVAPGEVSPTPTQEEKAYLEAIQWMKEKAPNVLKMKEPLTLKQYCSLVERFDPAVISEVLQDMHNWKPLLSKRTNAYRTFLKFNENRRTA